MNAAADIAGGAEETLRPGEALASYVEAVRRRAMPMGIAFGSTLMLALLLAAFWPPTYLSKGTILIEQQEIPQDYVRSAISSFADERVQVISQRVMTSANLLSIIDKFGLYADERDTETREALVERMREDIQLEMISADVVDPRQGRATKATIAFSVGYEAAAAQTAARVANDIVSLYLSENLQTRRRQAEGSATFLAGEAERLRQRIDELEAGIATFKKQNYDRLPEFAQSSQAQLERANFELRDVDSRVRALDQQIVFLDAQLVQISPTSEVITGTYQRLLSSGDRLKVLRSERSALIARYSPDHPDVKAVEREIASLEREVGGVDATNDLVRRLEQARADLATVRDRYSPDHPDVRRLEREVASLEAQLRAAPAASPRPTVQAPDNPAYIQISAQRQAAAAERGTLVARRAELQANIAEHERSQLAMPEVEREYAAMLREVDSEKAKFNEVRQKQLEAELAQNLETEQKGERFTLIEPPMAPQVPASPNRKAILALGLLLAIGAAVGVMMLLEALDARVRGRRELVALVGVPPLAIIPWVAPQIDAEARRRRRLQFAAGVAGGAVAVVLAVHVLVKPLDVLWAVLLRRLGAG